MATGNAPIELARETCEQRGILICDTGERGLGLEENVRLCSPMFAYVRLMGKKMFEGNVPGNPERNLFDGLGIFRSGGAYTQECPA